MQAGDQGNQGAGGVATTHWSLILDATTSTSASEFALRELCQTYWGPLYVFARRRGLPPPEAEDQTQAFLAAFLAGDYLSRADPERGRFRSFLVSCFENYLRNEWRRSQARKRGGDQRWVTLDVALLEQAAGPASESLPPDVAYNRQWARSLLNVVFRRLREEWAASDRLGLFEQLEPHLWGDVTAVPYPDLAQRFGLTQVNLRVMLHRLRQRYRSILLETVAQTVADPAEVDGELQFLIQVLRQ